MTRAMLRDVERCQQCGFEYREARAAEAARAIGDGAAGLAAILELGGPDLGARREPARWSPLEYACYVRDMLLVQRERPSRHCAMVTWWPPPTPMTRATTS